MIFLYTTLLVFLGVLKFLATRRARSLERKYVKVASTAGKLVRDGSLREGNSSRADPCLHARRQYELGQLVQKRERLEVKHNTWQARSERLGRVVRAMQNWRGRKLPYTFGVLDVATTLYAIDALGFEQYASAKALVQAITTLIFNG